LIERGNKSSSVRCSEWETRYWLWLAVREGHRNLDGDLGVVDTVAIKPELGIRTFWAFFFFFRNDLSAHVDKIIITKERCQIKGKLYCGYG
jgi:hypothetical protein